MKFNFLFAIVVLMLGFTSCVDPNVDLSTESSDGIKPIYISSALAKSISYEPPIDIIRLGKIYTKTPFIYVNELSKGVHVIDNTDPNAPNRIGFINIPGNQDISIKGNYLYANNMTDLVTIDISDLNNLQVVSRLENLYEEEELNYPVNYNGYFECVDESRGVVVGWETAFLTDPKCFR